MKELVFLLVFLLLSTAFAVAALIASFVCSPKASTDEKSETYECGMSLFSDAKVLFDFKYFNYAIVFLVFDIETIFLFPFALNFNLLEAYALIEVAIFVFLLALALAYILKTRFVG